MLLILATPASIAKNREPSDRHHYPETSGRPVSPSSDRLILEEYEPDPSSQEQQRKELE